MPSGEALQSLFNLIKEKCNGNCEEGCGEEGPGEEGCGEEGCEEAGCEEDCEEAGCEEGCCACAGGRSACQDCTEPASGLALPDRQQALREVLR
jgi:hypothetical protein